jgi:hypothetical protein
MLMCGREKITIRTACGHNQSNTGILTDAGRSCPPLGLTDLFRL